MAGPAAIALALTIVPTAGGASRSMASWRTFAPISGAIDVVGPRRDGSLVVAAHGRLSLLASGSKRSRPFARGRGGYATSTGTEAYIALAGDRKLAGRGCSFVRDDVFALEPAGTLGVVRIDGRGHAKRFANLPVAAGLPNGIAFDGVGKFGYRLLVTQATDTATTVYAIDCRGRVRTLTKSAPRVEGGIEVAPPGFGRFAGQLIAPDELTDRLWAVDHRGRSRLVARPGLPSGGDIGAESIGFVPSGFEAGAALLGDRGVPGSPHPGTDTVLRVKGSALSKAGVRSGDLLVVAEGGALTVRVRCGAKKCSVSRVADDPAVAHAEGHVAFDIPGG